MSIPTGSSRLKKLNGSVLKNQQAILKNLTCMFLDEYSMSRYKYLFYIRNIKANKR